MKYNVGYKLINIHHELLGNSVSEGREGSQGQRDNKLQLNGYSCHSSQTSSLNSIFLYVTLRRNLFISYLFLAVSHCSHSLHTDTYACMSHEKFDSVERLERMCIHKKTAPRSCGLLTRDRRIHMVVGKTPLTISLNIH